MGGVKWAASENTVVFMRGSQTCWRTFGMQHTLNKKNLSRWPARNSGCSLFSGSALKTAGDAFTSNKVTGHKSMSERTAWWWGSLHSLFDCECVCACLNVCLHQRANIREAWGVVLTLKIDGWSLRKKKRPIFYCNNTDTTLVCACACVCVYVCIYS